MRRLTLRERDTLQVGTDQGLGEHEVRAFAQLQPSLPAGALIWEHRAIRFGPFCGVLRAGDVTVELLPKIDDGYDTDDTACGLLIAMLRTTGTLNVSNVGEAGLAQQTRHLLDCFILDFCVRVNLALRGGAIVHYQEYAENLNALRGRIRLTEHLRLNSFDQSRLYCGFDERTIDNPHNRALKAVLTRLVPLTASAPAKAIVTTLLHRFDEVTQTPVTPLDIDHLSFDRMIHRWEPVFERAKWLLQGLFPDVRGGEVNGSCLLFNMERLFEAFLGVKLRQAWQTPSAGHFRVVLQGPRQILAQSEKRAAFRLRPDIAVMDGDRVIRIFDAKWKRLDSRISNSGILISDVHQLTSYASRYSCDRVALVYPASAAFPAGVIDTFTLGIPNKPNLNIHAVDIRRLADGAGLQSDLCPSTTNNSSSRTHAIQ